MMSPYRRGRISSPPNLITLVRIGSIPIMVILLYLDGRFFSWLAGIVFFVAGSTDLLDGWLARRMKEVSILGTYLDPVADKLMVSSILVMLTGMGRAPAWIAIIIIAREIAVSGMRAVAESQGFTVPSDFLGKSKTAVQMLALLLLILHYPMGSFDPKYWGAYCLWAAMVFTIFSGLAYFIKFLRELGASQP